MATAERQRIASLHRARSELAARLQARRDEVEQAALARVHAVADPEQIGAPEYAAGLRAAVTAAVDYGLASIERGEDRSPEPPSALLAQVRLAARHGVSLETVLRRCFAGYTLLADYLVCEAREGGLLHEEALQRALRAQAATFDRLIAIVTEEHSREARARPSSSEERHAERIQRLLAGELVDTTELRYDFDARHIGLIAVGEKPVETLRDLSRALGHSLLWARRDEATVWAWLGGDHVLQPDALKRAVAQAWPKDLTLSVGEPAEGLAGWRLTYRQARAALPIALSKGEPLTRYRDVALLASMLRDDLLVTSLHQLYVEPLEAERGGREVLRGTLRAYFAADRNVSSAAAALGISRQAVNGRLRMVESTLDRPLRECAADLEAVIRIQASDALSPLDGLSSSSPPSLSHRKGGRAVDSGR